MFKIKIKVYGTEVEVDPSLEGSAPITEEALSFIQMHTAGSTVLEIGCGSGIYAKLLRDRGVEVIATDACRINKEGLPSQKNRMAKFTNRRAINNMIEKNAVEAVQNHGQNTS
jgi:2-polyprenyl-3-methyl-5-hydroxy-6-metoxy-1,4-benzoquinol methylase